MFICTYAYVYIIYVQRYIYFMREFTIKNAAPQDRDNRFVRACTVEMHMDISQACKNFQKKCRGADGAPWSNPGLNSYPKNPSVWTPCLGNKKVETGISNDWLYSWNSWGKVLWTVLRILQFCCWISQNYVGKSHMSVDSNSSFLLADRNISVDVCSILGV